MGYSFFFKIDFFKKKYYFQAEKHERPHRCCVCTQPWRRAGGNRHGAVRPLHGGTREQDILEHERVGHHSKRHSR